MECIGVWFSSMWLINSLVKGFAKFSEGCSSIQQTMAELEQVQNHGHVLCLTRVRY